MLFSAPMLDNKFTPWREVIANGEARLHTAGLARSEMRAVATYVLGIDEDALGAQLGSAVSPDYTAKVEDILRRRLAGEPLARIVGYASVQGMRLTVGANIFRPIITSDSMIEHTLDLMAGRAGPLRILDLGTGTGAILLALLKLLPQASGIGVDSNEAALALARENAANHSFTARAEFLQSDWSADVLHQDFDLVISNPPQIPHGQLKHLVPELRDHDPHDALDGGNDGLRFYRRTALDFRRLTKPDGWGVMQLNGMVALPAQRLLKKEHFRHVAIKRDYKGTPNCVVFQNGEKPASFLSRLFTP